MRPRISIRGCVRPSVGPSVRRSVRWSIHPWRYGKTPLVEMLRAHLVARQGLFLLELAIYINPNSYQICPFKDSKNRDYRLTQSGILIWFDSENSWKAKVWPLTPLPYLLRQPLQADISKWFWAKTRWVHHWIRLEKYHNLHIEFLKI